MSNYGELHFGVSVFEYFPWYSYPNSISEQPELSRFYPLYRGAIKFDMCSVWHGDQSHLSTGGGGLFTKESRLFVIDRVGKTLNGEQSIESWLDVEKLRLITNLGLKSDSEKYLNNLDRMRDFIAVIEDAELDYDGVFNISEDFYFSSCNTLIREGMIKLTDEDVISYIRKYNGSIDFHNSLKRYLSKNGSLTWRQIEAFKKKPPIDIFNLPDFCLSISSLEVAKLITPRLKNMGYKIVDSKIVY